MADSRTVPSETEQWFIPRISPLNKPVPPPWHTGGSLFTYGVNPNLVEPLNELPLAYKFSSPFVDGDAIDSYYTFNMPKRDIKGLAISRDWAEIKDYPPDDFWMSRLPFAHRPVIGYFFKCMYDFAVHAWYAPTGLGTPQLYNSKLLYIDVPSGGKTLTKQDFKIKTRPPFWGGAGGSDAAPAFGGFSMHEVDTETLTAEEHYTKVRKRVLVICADLGSTQSTPFIKPDGLYEISTDPAKQFSVTGDGRYWANFHASQYEYWNLGTTSFFVYPTTSGWLNMMVFVGEFSLKQFHDYITDTDKYFLLERQGNGYGDIFQRVLDPMHYAFITYAGNANTDSGHTGFFNSSGQRKVDGDKDLITGKPHYGNEFINYKVQFFNALPKFDPAYSTDPTYKQAGTRILTFDVKKAGDLNYYVDGYYHQITLMRHPDLVTNGVLATPKDTKQGIFEWKYLGTGKIDAYTFDGAAPTPYKPVYILERNTGRMIRETVSDGNGRYVVHALPTGIEYIAVSVDPKKTMNSAIEEFGAL